MTSMHARPYVRVIGNRRGKTIRRLFREGCNVTEIAAFLGTKRQYVRCVLAYKRTWRT